METFERDVAELMAHNRRQKDGYTYTVPSPDLYPFQWLWDSCFHAIVLSRWDVAAARAELRSAVARPLPSGLIPHINYWEEPDEATNWGREMRGDVINGSWGVLGRSAITQPPLLALALARVYQADSDGDFVRELYPVLRAHYGYLLRERTFGESKLLYLINPDESGEDNSPRFDAAGGLSLAHTAAENLEVRVRLMRENAACQFDARTCMNSIFAVADVPFNCLFHDALGHLAELAGILKIEQDVRFFTAQQALLRTALRAELHLGNGEFYSYDRIKSEHSLVKTWALFMPLYVGIVSQREAAHLVEKLLLHPNLFGTEWSVPTVATNEPSFDPSEGFWRGPVWMAPNWFIYHGLKRYGYHDAARSLREKSRLLIEQSGFREQYNPLTGEGCGALNFTWGGLVLDMD